MPTVTRRAALLSPLLCAAPPRWELRAEDRLDRRGEGLTFEQFIQAALDEYVVPGAVVVVSSAAGTVFLKGFGIRRNGGPDAVDGERASRSPR